MSKKEKVVVHPVSPEWAGRAQARLDSLTKPPGSLGALEAVAVRLAAILETDRPQVNNPFLTVMAADHGVVEEGVSAYPAEVTTQMMANFLAGGAAASVLSRLFGVRLVLTDVGVASDLPPYPGLLRRKVRPGTANFTRGPAMTPAEAREAVSVGIEVAESCIARGADLICLGEMGIGNTTPSAAITCLLSGRSPREVVGRGTGVDDSRLERKIEAVERALAVNRPDPVDPFDILAKVGGLEIGALAGVVIGAASARVPVIVDGFISSAAAALATLISPASRDYLLASHLSAEPGHRVILDFMGLKAVIQGDLRLGEGTGALLAVPLVKAACSIIREMATFEEAGVSDG